MTRVCIIAEAGVNHNGSLERAMEMVDAAAAAGADYIKFQTFQTRRLVTRHALKAEYQKSQTEQGSQFDMLAALELDESAHRQLLQHCQKCGIGFLSTAFDLESLDLLRSLGICTWKIPSGEITNWPLLHAIGKLAQPVILSSGMSTLGEIESALQVLYDAGTKPGQITLLHCTTEYPAPLTEVNLHAMETMRQAFQLPVGYSDHTVGITIPIAAVAMGATIIEKHFTLDRSLPGPDHAASLEPKELAQMVAAIRAVETALGDGNKRVMPSELSNRAIARKSIVAATAIQAGDTFSADNLTTKRPGTGLSPMAWKQLLGQKASRSYQPDDFIVVGELGTCPAI